MHVLAVNSVSTMLNYLSEQLQKTPTLEEIQAWHKDPDENEEESSDSDKVDIVLWLFSQDSLNHLAGLLTFILIVKRKQIKDVQTLSYYISVLIDINNTLIHITEESF